MLAGTTGVCDRVGREVHTRGIGTFPIQIQRVGKCAAARRSPQRPDLIDTSNTDVAYHRQSICIVDMQSTFHRQSRN